MIIFIVCVLYLLVFFLGTFVLFPLLQSKNIQVFDIDIDFFAAFTLSIFWIIMYPCILIVWFIRILKLDELYKKSVKYFYRSK